MEKKSGHTIENLNILLVLVLITRNNFSTIRPPNPPTVLVRMPKMRQHGS
jgi:hypothetical protein